MTRHLLRLMWNRKRRNLMLAVEIFCSFIVLTLITIVAINGLSNWGRDLGYRIDDVWRVSLEIPPAPAEQTRTTLTRMLNAVAALPGVRSAALVNLTPYAHGHVSEGTRMFPDGRRRNVRYNAATEGLPDVISLDIVAGRWFNASDRDGVERPVIINARLARTLFGDSSLALGQLVTAVPASSSSAPKERVIGVITDFRKDGELDTPTFDLFYSVSLAPTGDAASGRPAGASTSRQWQASNLLIKVSPGTPAAFEETVVSTLQSLARDWGFTVSTLAQNRSTTLGRQFAMFAVPATIAGFLLLMVALGLMGVLWQNVTQRTREFGLRRAAGASAKEVRRQVLIELIILASFAVVPGALLLAQVPALPLPDLSEDLAPADVYLMGVAVSVCAIYVFVLICGWYPSRMATRILPAQALHYE